jgi:hypothetical protein
VSTKTKPPPSESKGGNSASSTADQSQPLCSLCGRPQLPDCKDGATSHPNKQGGGACFSACENFSAHELELWQAKKDLGPFVWRDVYGTARTWKGDTHSVYSVGVEDNDLIIIRDKDGNLRRDEKSHYEEIAAEPR